MHGVVCPVESYVESELVESKLCFLQLSLEVILGALALFVECISGIHLWVRFPGVQTINFVQSDAEGCPFVFKQLNRLERLLL